MILCEVKKLGKVLAVIGVGNMARAIVTGIDRSSVNVDSVWLYDKVVAQYDMLECGRLNIVRAESIESAVSRADIVLISVKPQNYDDALSEIVKSCGYSEKLYISIGAGITSESVSSRLGGADVIRVLPNVPILIGKGVSVICENLSVGRENFEFVCSIFSAAGSNIVIDESEMNRMIGVTSSSPAYVFKFIDSIYKGAISQGLDNKDILDSICDVLIGSALLLKNSSDTPEELIAKVASKGGTTERALAKLDEYGFEEAVVEAMIACTKRADELGKL